MNCSDEEPYDYELRPLEQCEEDCAEDVVRDAKGVRDPGPRGVWGALTLLRRVAFTHDAIPIGWPSGVRIRGAPWGNGRADKSAGVSLVIVSSAKPDADALAA